MYNCDPYNVLLAIATNIAVLLMTAFVLQGHITHMQNQIYYLTYLIIFPSIFVCVEMVLVLQDSIPFAVIGSNTVVEAKGKRVRGRLYPWGIVEGMIPTTNTFPTSFPNEEIHPMS